MKIMKKLATLAVLSLFALSLSSCSKKEDKLAGHLKKADSIMQSNMDSPKKGVEKMIKYIENEGPDAVKLGLEMGIEIANIDGDGDREKRVKEIKETLDVPMKNFEGTAKKFFEKVEADKDAKTYAKEYMERYKQVGELLEMMEKAGRF